MIITKLFNKIKNIISPVKKVSDPAEDEIGELEEMVNELNATLESYQQQVGLFDMDDIDIEDELASVPSLNDNPEASDVNSEREIIKNWIGLDDEMDSLYPEAADDLEREIICELGESPSGSSSEICHLEGKMINSAP